MLKRRVMSWMSPEIIGNPGVLESLERLARSRYLGHAYLFLGPEGVGKRLAALAFARAVNCRCGEGPKPCDSCRLMASLNHPEVLLLEDANKPRWLKRASLRQALGLGGKEAHRDYALLVAELGEKGFLEEPLPRTDMDLAVDGFTLVTDKIFGRGSVPSRECYTPGPVSEEIRQAYDGGSLTEQEYILLKMLYEYPLSVMPYRGAIPLAYVASRKAWKFTRPIQPFLGVRSMLEGHKIVIVDDAHKMTAEAQNCLLKTLEEPPADSLLILVTADRRGLFETIVSRCQVVNFGRLSKEEMAAAGASLVGGALAGLGVVVSLSENCPGRLMELSLRDMPASLSQVRDFFDHLAKGSLAAGFGLSRGIIEAGGTHRRKQRQSVVEALELVGLWLAELLRAQCGLPDSLGVPEYSRSLKEQAGVFAKQALLDAASQLEKAFSLVRLNIDMSLLLDTTLLRIARTLTGPNAATPGSELKT